MTPDNLTQNLLFGVLAVKAEVFDTPQLTTYWSAWGGRQEMSLADWLVTRDWISQDDRTAVDRLIELKRRKYGSLQASLVAAMDAQVARALQAVDDPEIRRFINGLALADGSEKGAQGWPATIAPETLPTARLQSSSRESEVCDPATVRLSAGTRPEGKPEVRQRGSLFRMLITAGVTAVIVGLIGLALGYMWLTEVNRQAEEARDQLAQRDQQVREYLALAREAVDEFQSKVESDPQLKERNLDLWRQAVLQKAVAAYKKFVAQWGEEPDLLAELARAYGRLGKITGVVGNKNEALALFEEAIPIEEKLIADYPDQMTYVVDLGGHRCELADLLRQTDKINLALDHLSKAIQALGIALERDPHDLKARRYLAIGHNIRGAIYQHDGKADQSQTEFQKGAALLEKNLPGRQRSIQDAVLLSMIYGNLGELRRRYGTAEQAIPWCRRAVETLEAVEPKNPANSDFQTMLARACYTLGVAYFSARQLDQAEESWAKALPMTERLAAGHPKITEYQVQLGSTQNNLGVIHLRQNRFKEAETAFNQALATSQKLIALNPNVPEYQAGLANNYGNLAEVYSAMGVPDKAADSLRQATAIRKKLVDDHPANSQYRINLAASSLGLAQQNVRTGKLDEALTAYQQAENVYDGSPRMAEIGQKQYELAGSYKDLALRYKTAGKLEQANATYRRMLALVEKVTAGFPSNVDYALGLGSTYYEFGFFLKDQGKAEEVLTWFAKAIHSLETLQKKEPGHAKVLEYLRNSHWARARALVQLKRPKESLPDFDQAINWDTGVSHNALAWERLLTQARAGECEQATSEAEKRLNEKKRPAAEWYQAARIFAVASVTIRDDAGLTPAEQDQRADRFAARAVAILQKIQETGFFHKNPAAVVELEQETDFQVLRKRQDYQKLSKTIEGAASP